MNNPALITVRGLPGSGKTHLAEQLKHVFGDDNTLILDPDSISYDGQEYKEHTKTLSDEGVDPALHAYRFLRAKAYKGIEDNKIIIWNQPFTNLEIFNKMIGRLKDHAALHKKRLHILVVEVEVDPTIAKERIEHRRRNGGHGPSENTFQRFVNDYASFDKEGYNVVKVDGDDNDKEAIATIKKAFDTVTTKNE